MNISDAILSRGDDAAPALVCQGTTVTYRELRQSVRRVAEGLLARGCVKGDRIGIWSENSPFFVAAYLGIIHAGLVAVPFQTDVSPETFDKIVRDAGIN